MSETQQNIDTALVPTPQYNAENEADASGDTMTDFRQQAQKYGEQATDALNKAKGYAQEYGQQAVDKFRDLQGKDLTQIKDEAKDFARRKPVETVAIAAAVGLLLGLLLKRR